MAIQSQPSRIPEPFAGSGTKNTIPATNATPSASQAASWASGFPPECSQPISAGGCPVPRNDVNGALNQLSQDFAFRQDGGIWEWSALADYDTQRMVRGSDGLLYWSAAQSGPGFASGAVDPTADDGTYWQAPYAKTMPPLENSGALASTKWVRDAMEAAPIYVDGTNGNDASDGLSSATAVKTVAQALALGVGRTGILQTIHLAGGTYSESVALNTKNVEFILDGNVTFSNGLQLQNSTLFIADTDTYTLTVSSSNSISFYVRDGSRLFCSSPLSITTSSAGDSLRVTGVSSCLLYKDLTVSCTSVTRAIEVRDNSEISIYGDVDISGSSITYGINIETNSVCSTFGDITMHNASMATAVYVSSVSAMFIAGGSVSGYASGVGVIRVEGNSYLNQASGTTITTINTGNGAANSACINIDINSCVDIYGNMNLSNTSATGCILYISGESFFGAFSSAIAFGGTVSNATVVCRTNSHAFFNYASTTSGSVTGKRYDVSILGSINTGGKGANFFPGTTAGTAASASYGYYA